MNISEPEQLYPRAQLPYPPYSAIPAHGACLCAAPAGARRVDVRSAGHAHVWAHVWAHALHLLPSCAHRLLRILELDAATIVVSGETRESEKERGAEGGGLQLRWKPRWRISIAGFCCGSRCRSSPRRRASKPVCWSCGTQGPPWPGGAIQGDLIRLSIVKSL